MSKLKTNFIYDTIYQVLILIIPFVTTPYIARTMGATGVGSYSYTYSIVSYFMMFALLGMNNYGNREIAKIKEDKEKINSTFSSIYYLQLITTIILVVFYVIYIKFFESQYQVLALIQILHLISVAFDVNWLFCGLQEFKTTVTRSGIIKILSLVLIFVFLKNENDLWKYTLILSGTTLLNQLILWPFLKKHVRFVKVEKKDIIKHLRPTLILFIPIIATSVYRVMDKIMIGNITDIQSVGYYENAEKMLNIILAVVSALVTVTLPQMTYLYNNNKIEEYNKILDKSIKLIFFMVFPVIFGFLATANILVSIYLGNEFLPSANLLKILSVSLLFSPIASIVRMQILIPRNKDKEYIISVISGAIVNFGLNFILIKNYGAVGATIATIIAEFTVATLQIIFVRKEFKIDKYLKGLFNFAIKSVIMFLIVIIVGQFFRNDIVKLIIQIAMGILIYITLNIRYINEEINFRSLIKKRG